MIVHGITLMSVILVPFQEVHLKNKRRTCNTPSKNTSGKSDASRTDKADSIIFVSVGILLRGPIAFGECLESI